MPEIVLPDSLQLARKYLEEYRECTQDAACRNLLGAILEQALSDIRDDCDRQGALYWIFSDVGSFPSLCEILGLDAGQIRRSVLRFLARVKDR